MHSHTYSPVSILSQWEAVSSFGVYHISWVSLYTLPFGAWVELSLVTGLVVKKVARGGSWENQPYLASNDLKGRQYDSSGKGKLTPSGKRRRSFYRQRWLCVIYGLEAPASSEYARIFPYQFSGSHSCHTDASTLTKETLWRWEISMCCNLGVCRKKDVKFSSFISDKIFYIEKWRIYKKNPTRSNKCSEKACKIQGQYVDKHKTIGKWNLKNIICSTMK